MTICGICNKRVERTATYIAFRACGRCLVKARKLSAAPKVRVVCQPDYSVKGTFASK